MTITMSLLPVNIHFKNALSHEERRNMFLCDRLIRELIMKPPFNDSFLIALQPYGSNFSGQSLLEKLDEIYNLETRIIRQMKRGIKKNTLREISERKSARTESSIGRSVLSTLPRQVHPVSPAPKIR